MLVTFTGASGSGKSSLIRALTPLLPGAALSPGCTTRSPRHGESSNDVESLTTEEFEDETRRGQFLWTIEVHGHLYGTRRSEMTRGLRSDASWILVILAPQVIDQLGTFATELDVRSALYSVYVQAPPVDVLVERMRRRDLAADARDIERRVSECLEWDRLAWECGTYDVFARGDGELARNASDVASELRSIFKRRRVLFK